MFSLFLSFFLSFFLLSSSSSSSSSSSLSSSEILVLMFHLNYCNRALESLLFLLHFFIFLPFQLDLALELVQLQEEVIEDQFAPRFLHQFETGLAEHG